MNTGTISVNSPVLNLAELEDDLRLLTASAHYAERAADRLETHVADLRQRYAMYQQDRTNRRLAVLTVISAIFLPLTLIAGIYGMNFDVMPELHFAYSYPLTLLGMVAIAAGLYWFFRKASWPEMARQGRRAWRRLGARQ